MQETRCLSPVGFLRTNRQIRRGGGGVDVGWGRLRRPGRREKARGTKTGRRKRPHPTTSATPAPTGTEPLPLESGGLRTLGSPMVGGMMRWQETQHKNTLERCDGHKQLFSSSGGRRGET